MHEDRVLGLIAFAFLYFMSALMMFTLFGNTLLAHFMTWLMTIFSWTRIAMVYSVHGRNAVGVWKYFLTGR